MFPSLKYFIFAAFLVVVAGAASVGWYFKELKTKEILSAAYYENAGLIGSYTSTIWAKNIVAVPSISVANPTEYGKATDGFFQSFGFLKLTLFTPDLKTLFYSSTPNIVTNAEDARIPLFNMPEIQKGRLQSRVLEDSYLGVGPQRSESKILIQSIVPIFAAEMPEPTRQACLRGTATTPCTPVALAEIYRDITPFWHSLQQQQLWLIAAIIGTFAALGGALLVITARAGSIIARQHELNLELTAAATRAEAQSKDKSQFLASVSHELRTPLNSIIGFSEIVKNEARDHLQKIYLDYIEDIYASGRHLLSLINDILDYSKAEAGKLQIEWAETDVTKVIRNSLRMVMPRAETAQVTLVEDLPSGHLIITTDAKKLKQVLLNLLSNAVKFTPVGGEVRCQAWEDIVTHHLVIQVRDTGIGIAAKDISKVMTPFGQVDSALSRKYEGTGLGLPLAKVFMESMGGSFAIESVLNEGTTITITLPKAPSAALQQHTQGTSNVASI